MKDVGTRKGIAVKEIKRIILTDHHPECHRSLATCSFLVPMVDRNIMMKNVYWHVKAQYNLFEQCTEEEGEKKKKLSRAP